MQTELFDRYVHQVGQRLPRRLRADVEAELHSSLMDALQARTAEEESEDGVHTEAVQVAILEEFGPPAELAAQYQPHRRYLIGPRFLDLYLLVAAVVAGSQALLYLLLLALMVWQETGSSGSFILSLADLFRSFLGFALAGFGFVTLVFAILERVRPDSIADSKDDTPWDPRTLPEVKDRTEIKAGQLIFETSLTVMALIVFNLFPEWIGFNYAASINGAPMRWYSVPLLSPAFFTNHLPLLNALWALTIGLNIVLLRQGRWQRLTRVVDCVLAVLGGFIIYRMISGPAILSMEAISPESLRQALGSILPGLLKLSLLIGLLGTIVAAIQKLVLVFRTGTVPGHPNAHMVAEG